MQKELIKSVVAAIAGVAFLGMVGVLTGSIDLGSEVWSLGDQNAALLGGIALLVGAFIHGRSPDTYDTWELVAAGAAVGLVLVTYMGQPQAVVDALDKHHPWSSIGAAAVAYTGYWVSSFR